MKRRILVWGGFLLLVGLMVWLWKNNWAAIHFVDEEDNMVAGQMMREEKVLYRDIFSHHQPLGYLISREVQEAREIGSVLQLIKTHRLVVVVWAVFWWGLIVAKTGYLGIFLGLIYEMVKYKYLGNLFLGEALSVYPLIYTLIVVFEDKRKRWEMVMAGVALSVAWWLLASNAIVVVLLGLYLVIKDKNRWWLVVGAVGISLLVLSQISMVDYWQNGVITNLRVYIPNTQGRPGFGWSSDILWLAVAAFILINFKKFPIVWWGCLMAVGLRGVHLGGHFYNGFHYLPWIGLCLSGVVLKSKWWVVISILVFAVAGNFGLLNAAEAAEDFDINFAEQREIREVINVLKNETDKLFVDPDEMLMYWKTATPLTRYIFYYGWMEGFEVDFEKESPEFWYHQERENRLDMYLENYVQVKRKGRETDLYILKEKVESLDETQLGNLEYLGFEL